MSTNSLDRARRLSMVALLGILCTGAAPADVPLIEAVKAGDTAIVRALLEQQAAVNAAEVDGTTALHWAAHRDAQETAELLIRAGANVQAANRYGVTPLALACTNGSAAMIEMLLTAGADPNTASPEGETPLMTAARTGTVAAVKVLLAHGADVEAKEGWRGQTALMWAAAQNNAATARALIEAGADVHARSNGGFTPLLFAVRASHLDALRVLGAAGANVDDTLPNGTSALVVAIINAHYDLAAWLLDEGANSNADAQGWTALHQLVWTRRPNLGRNPPFPVPTGELDGLDMARVLLAHGADPNARQKKEPRDGNRNLLNRIGATPFLLAAKAADVEMMRLLADNGADPLLTTAAAPADSEERAEPIYGARRGGNTTPLMAAAGVGIWKIGENPGTNQEALDAVRLAWELGGDVNAVDDNGDTALHGAAYRGANGVVQFLVDKGAKLDVANKIGWTPLTIAEGVWYPNTYNRQPATAELLRQLGADPQAGRRRPIDFPPGDRPPR